MAVPFNIAMLVMLLCVAVLYGVQILLRQADTGAAVICGAFLPFFLRGKFDAGIISFPHLAERFELLSIITFGEGVVAMTGYFAVTRLSLSPVLVFAILLTLFGGYVVQVHYRMDHHRSARSLRLMLCHCFIVIAVNLVTVALASDYTDVSDDTWYAEGVSALREQGLMLGVGNDRCCVSGRALP